MRGGHIPGAKSVPWARAANDDGTFKSRDELEDIYLREQGLTPDDDVVAYCRIGERSSHTWFVLTHLLGFESVRNYDGSWTEWGNAVRVPDREVTSTEPQLPTSLAEIAEDFRSATNDLKLQLLLEFSDELPELPERYAGQLDKLERVDECQTPLFLIVEVDDGDSLTERSVHLFFDAPSESPTTRGFAGILHEGLDGLTAARGPGRPRRRAHAVRPGRGGLPAAASRDGGDARAHQAAGPREDQLTRTKEVVCR